MPAPYFHPFRTPPPKRLLPKSLNDPFGAMPPEIGRLAATELQEALTRHRSLWPHNFGMTAGVAGKGKMFGVLVVRQAGGQVGYLSGCSGKLDADPPGHPLVPSVFDDTADSRFLDRGMEALTAMSKELEQAADAAEATALRAARHEASLRLQMRLFAHYQFLSQKGEWRGLCAIFEEAIGGLPPSGAGECAAPKLLQYAFEHDLEPLAIAEFWWGKPPKSDNRQHGCFYPACRDKCRPILGFMLA